MPLKIPLGRLIRFQYNASLYVTHSWPIWNKEQFVLAQFEQATKFVSTTPSVTVLITIQPEFLSWFSVLPKSTILTAELHPLCKHY